MAPVQFLVQLALACFNCLSPVDQSLNDISDWRLIWSHCMFCGFKQPDWACPCCCCCCCGQLVVAAAAQLPSTFGRRYLPSTKLEKWNLNVAKVH